MLNLMLKSSDIHKQGRDEVQHLISTWAQEQVTELWTVCLRMIE